MSEALLTMSLSAIAPSPPKSNSGLRKIVVSNFEEGGIVYCKDANNVVYDTEDVYFDVRPARAIGTCVDGAFVPYAKTTVSCSSPPDSATSKTTSPASSSPLADS